jgi:hypothetical protein
MSAFSPSTTKPEITPPSSLKTRHMVFLVVLPPAGRVSLFGYWLCVYPLLQGKSPFTLSTIAKASLFSLNYKTRNNSSLISQNQAHGLSSFSLGVFPLFFMFISAESLKNHSKSQKNQKI